MAFPIQGNTTTAAGYLGNTIPTLYERVMIDWLIPELRFYVFGAKTPLQKGMGKSVIWNRKVTIAEGYKATEGSPISAVKTLSTNKVSALIETVTDAIALSELSYLTSVIATDQYALEVLSQAAAVTIDKYILQCIVSDSVARHYVKKAGSVVSSNSAAVSATASGPRLALSDVRVAATYLQGQNAKTFDGQSYIGIVHPKQLSDLYADAGYTNWVQYQYAEKMFDFEVGKIFNVRIMTSTMVPTSSASAQGAAQTAFTPSSVSTIAYAMTIFGKDAYGVTELDGGVQTFVNTDASKSDPTNLTRVYGYKANLAAKVLNPSALVFIWNGVGDVISALSTVSDRRAAGITMDTDQIPSW